MCASPVPVSPSIQEDNCWVMEYTHVPVYCSSSTLFFKMTAPSHTPSTEDTTSRGRESSQQPARSDSGFARLMAWKRHLTQNRSGFALFWWLIMRRSLCTHPGHSRFPFSEMLVILLIFIIGSSTFSLQVCAPSLSICSISQVVCVQISSHNVWLSFMQISVVSVMRRTSCINVKFTCFSSLFSFDAL